MFYSITQKKTKMTHEPSQLINAVPLCSRTVILFFSDATFHHYSLLQERTIYKSKLPSQVHRAVAVSSNQIIVSVIQTRDLVLLDIKNQQIFQICKIPKINHYSETKAKQLFFSCIVGSFKKTGGFFFIQQTTDPRKHKIFYACGDENIRKAKFIDKQISMKGQVCDKTDQESCLAIYKQNPEKHGKFNFSVIDLQKNVEQRKYYLTHESFEQYSTVVEIKKVGKSKFLIFINKANPQIIVIQDQVPQLFPYASKKIFLMSILINIQLNYGIFVYLPQANTKINQDINVLELMNLQNGKIIEKVNFQVRHLVKSWQDDYFLDFRKDTKPKMQSMFYTRHIIDKKSHYMKILDSAKLFQDLPESFNIQVLNLLY